MSGFEAKGGAKIAAVDLDAKSITSLTSAYTTSASATCGTYVENVTSWRTEFSMIDIR